LKKDALKEFEADVLRIEYNGIRIKLDELIKERDRKQVKYSEDLCVKGTLHAMRKQIKFLTEERDAIKKCYGAVTGRGSKLSGGGGGGAQRCMRGEWICPWRVRREL
jgi:mevalonate kinase